MIWLIASIFVAIVLAARTFVREIVIREHLQPHRGNPAQTRSGNDGVGILLRTLAAGKDREVLLFGERRSVGGNERDRIKNSPRHEIRGERLFPNGHFG